MRKIIRNAIRCNLCGDIIESTYRMVLIILTDSNHVSLHLWLERI